MLRQIAFASFCINIGVACGSQTALAGEPGSRSYDFKDFTRVEASNAFDVELVPSAGWSTKVTFDAARASCLLVEQRGDTLYLGATQRCSVRPCDGCLRAEVSLPTLESVKLSGAAQARVEGFDGEEEVVLDLSGASQLRGDLRAERVEVDLSGASQLRLDGGAESLVVDASGASQAQLDAFPVETAEVELSGASHASIEVAKRLAVSTSGVSRLVYRGSPELSEARTSGMSSISKR